MSRGLGMRICLLAIVIGAIVLMDAFTAPGSQPVEAFIGGLFIGSGITWMPLRP